MTEDPTQKPVANTDLELATFEQIAAELGKRFTCVVLVTLADVANNPQAELPDIQVHGSQFTAMGLLEWARTILPD